ncbi:MAG: cytochrome P450 [Acidimicrobiia bacterium]
MVDLVTAFGDELHDVLREAASAGPLARDPETGVVIALRHADVDTLGRDPRMVGVGLGNFDVMGIADGPLRTWYSQLMFTNEGAAHRRLRSLVQKAFTPRAVDAIRAATTEMATQSFATLRAEGGGDLIEAASMVPLRVICRLIGVPDGDVEQFAGWADALSIIFGFLSAEQAEAATGALAKLNAYVDDLLEQRRSAPGDDLVSALVVAEVDGQRLTHDEVRTMVANLIVAGHDTTGSQIGCTFLTLLRHPDQATLLAGRPELVPNAVEETMRFEPSISGIPRTPTETIVVGGEEVPAGSVLILSTAAANREPGVWADPDTVDLGRFGQPNVPRLMSFGIGTHYCLGAALARMTLEESVRAMFVIAPIARAAVDLTHVEWRHVLGRSPSSLAVTVGA